MKEEWEEEMMKRKEINKSETPYENWIKYRPKRFRPLAGGV
jgi:hypothetical protein